MKIVLILLIIAIAQLNCGNVHLDKNIMKRNDKMLQQDKTRVTASHYVYEENRNIDNLERLDISLCKIHYLF
jgi:hypothetical protein